MHEPHGVRSIALDDAQRQLVEEHMPMVYSLASRWRAAKRQNIEQADLVQVGALGLMDAVRRYDPARARQFRAFARTRIEGSIRDVLRAVDPLSRHERQGVRRLEATARDLRAKLGREPETEEIAAALGWDHDETRRRRDDVHALQEGLARILPEPSEQGLESDRSEQPFVAVFDAELKVRVAQEIARLPRRQQVVLALYHHHRLTLRQVGEMMGVTESRICQIHSAALTTLRAGLRDLTPQAAVA